MSASKIMNVAVAGVSKVNGRTKSTLSGVNGVGLAAPAPATITVSGSQTGFDGVYSRDADHGGKPAYFLNTHKCAWSNGAAWCFFTGTAIEDGGAANYLSTENVSNPTLVVTWNDNFNFEDTLHVV